MKIFLSGVEDQKIDFWEDVNPDLSLGWTLMSYYYIRSVKDRKIRRIIELSDQVLVDSGAHSMQKGKCVDWDEYTDAYAQWIKEHDCDKIIGFFEMDVDIIIGYEKVLELRERLEKVSDKIIPVWHKGRGLEDYKKMCREYSGKIIAFTGFRNVDVSEGDFLPMLKYAWDNGCRVHCLGMTRQDVLSKVPFDYVDSSSWVQECIYGKAKGDLYGDMDDQKFRRLKGNEGDLGRLWNYEKWMGIQQYYYEKWKGVSPCGD